jgi:hypothetical protein
VPDNIDPRPLTGIARRRLAISPALLAPQDLWMPKPDGQKPVQVRKN